MFALKFIAFVGSACSLLYELILSKLLSFYTGEFVLWQSLTLACYLAALGFGVWYQSRSSGSWKKLFHIELILACVGALAVPCLMFLHGLYRMYWTHYGVSLNTAFSPLTAFAILSLPVLVMIGFLAGCELPLIFNLSEPTRSETSKLLGCTYFGALTGSLIFACVFLQKMDMASAGLWTSMGNFALALIVFFRRDSLEWKNSRQALYAMLISFLFAVCAFVIPEWEQISLQNFYYNRLEFSYSSTGEVEWNGPVGFKDFYKFIQKQALIKRVRTPYQSIDYVPDLRNPRHGFGLYLNGHYQFDTQKEASYHSVMTQSPILAFGEKPLRILVLGGGDGLLVRDLLRDIPEVERIQVVELDAKMIEEAKKAPLQILNQNAFHDPRVKVAIEDAFVWLRQSSEAAFDAIYADFPYPYDGETLRLFSAEFYKLAKRKLQVNGFLIADYPLDVFQKEDGAQVQASFRRAGFRQILRVSSPGESFVMASLHPKTIQREKLGKIQIQEIPAASYDTLVQSVLKPKALMQADPFF